MHPILSDREKLFVYLAAWLVIALLIAALVAIPGELGWTFALAFAIPASLVYAFICLSAWWLCRVYQLQKTNVLKLLGVYAVSASLSSSLWILLCNAWVWALNQSLNSGLSGERTAGEARLLFGIGVVLYLLAVAVHYLIIAFEASREAERRTMEMRVLAQEAELRALRAQIDPHFLFNSLNSISALTVQDPAAARSMTILLSDFFRRSLQLGSMELIPLKDELGLIRNFLEIEKIRFGKRLNVEMEIDNASLECMIPPLLLQPLVENAIGHGIAHMIEGGTISLRTQRSGSELTIIVGNPVDPERPKAQGTRVGMENVRRRLRTLFDSDARLVTLARDGMFFVEVSFPAKESTPP